MAQRNSNTQPKPTPQETGSEGTVQPPKGTKAATLLEMAQATDKRANANKSELLSKIRQRLAELQDYNQEAVDADATKSEQADIVATDLYQARVDGLMTADEVSALLGDYFGFKEKKDGTPSKTPDGLGNVLRQRIVRPVAAAQWLDGDGDGGRFFSELPETVRDDVASVRERLEGGEIGIFHAYKLLGDIRSGTVTRPKLAFDPSRISALADELANPEKVAAAWRENKALLAAFVKLHGVIGTVLSMPAE